MLALHRERRRARTRWRTCSSAGGATGFRSSRRRARASTRCSAAATRDGRSARCRPAMGEATLERVAACAVLAGCRPEYFPVVLAAVEAALEPAFNLNGQAVTTQPAGPARDRQRPGRARRSACTAAMGVLGPGWRANLTIGRALRLLVTLTGGGAPGRLDRVDARAPGQARLLHRRGRGGQPVGAAARRARVRARRLGRDGRRLRRAAVDLRPPQPRRPRTSRSVLGWAARRDVEPELVAARRDVACTSSAPSTQAMFGAAGWSKQRLREAMFDAVRKPARELRRGETTPQVHAADPDALDHQVGQPRRHRPDRRGRRGGALLRRARARAWA